MPSGKSGSASGSVILWFCFLATLLPLFPDGFLLLLFRPDHHAGQIVCLDHPAGETLVHFGLQPVVWRDYMRSKKGLLGYYNYTVILTYIGMLVAFFGIALVLEGEYCKAVLCLMVAGACDMFDGAVASTRPRMPKERRFGVQIDSLCDLICFGVLPALMVYILNGRSGIALVVCSPVCSMRADPAGLFQRAGGGAAG